METYEKTGKRAMTKDQFKVFILTLIIQTVVRNIDLWISVKFYNPIKTNDTDRIYSLIKLFAVLWGFDFTVDFL